MDFEQIVKNEFEKLNLPKRPFIEINNLKSGVYVVEVNIGDKMDLEQLGSIVFSYDYRHNKFYLSWIGLMQSIRKKGYAGAMIEAMENVAKKMNIKKIESNTPVVNPTSIAAYGYTSSCYGLYKNLNV